MAPRKLPDEDLDFLDFDLQEDGSDLESALAEETDSPKAPKKGAAGALPGVLMYEGRKYAVGLTWLVADDDAEAGLSQKRAKALQADFICSRASVANQQGFGRLAMGHRMGMSALAPLVADVLIGQWHGVFTADNGWWYLAINAENIAPQGDIFFLSEEEAYNHYLEESRKQHWPRSFAPAAWNLQDKSEELPLQKLLSEVDITAPALSPVSLDAVFSGRTNRNIALTSMALVLGLIGFVVVGQQIVPSLIPSKATVPLPNILVGDVVEAPPKEVVVGRDQNMDGFVRPSLLRPDGVMTKCLDLIGQIYVPIPGWDIQKAQCSPSGAQAAFQAKTLSMLSVLPYVQKLDPSIGRVFRSSTVLDLSIASNPKSLASISQNLMERDSLILTLSDRLSDFGQVAVTEVKSPAVEKLLLDVQQFENVDFKLLNETQPPTPLRFEDLPGFEVRFSTRLPPSELSGVFNIPGVELNNIEYDFVSGGWVYAARATPKVSRSIMDAQIKALRIREEMLK